MAHAMMTRPKRRALGAKMGKLLPERRLGPEERIYGGKGILMRFKPTSTSASSEKSDTVTIDYVNNPPQAPSASDPMLPAMNGLEQALRRKDAQVMARHAQEQSKAPGSTTAKPSAKP